MACPVVAEELLEVALAGAYAAQNAAPYGASHSSNVGYQPHPHPQQWAPEHGHGPSSQGAHPHAPAPISAANYHPNYAPPQPYPPPQYSQSYGAPQQYANPYQGPPQPAATHWGHQGSPQQGHYANGRGRGGYADRASKHSPMGAPPRQAYEQNPSAGSMGGAFGQPYAHDPHYAPSQYPYLGPPPPPAPLHHHQDGHHGQYHRRGRGGGPRDGGRGRGGFHHGGGGGDRARHQHQKQQAHANGNKKAAKAESQAQSAGKKKKRKTNTLGLTPGMDSESEDDEGEEKALVDLIGTETLQVSDVAAFLAERRKNYPTKARVESKKAAELARKDEDKASELEKQADKLRKQLRKVESSIKRKREQTDEGDEMRNHSQESDDDEKPEVMSSRTESAPSLAPTARKADVSRHCKYYATGGTCGKKGKCRFVHDPEVREAAMKEREANDGRITIQQRLILNDKEQEDLSILQSIQYLRDKGLMKSVPKPPTTDAMDVDVNQVKEKHVKPAATSLLPAAPASLPDPPAKREAGTARRSLPSPVVPVANSVGSQGSDNYQGWLLEPYGSANGKQSKSDDLP
ncbi:hypothetical protein RJ55_03368 [Drechmeria coniospora]|nr:hypothetical protein RJ55_03368 [Drechmeria coniospora]